MEFSSTLTTILVALPNLTIITDLLIKFETDPVFQKLTYLGGSEILIKAIQSGGGIEYYVPIIILIFLAFPLLLLILIVIKTIIKDNSKIIEQGDFKKGYENSIISRLIRLYVVTFPDIWFSIFVSIGIKIHISKETLFL